LAEPQRPATTRQDSKSLSVLLTELWDLIVAYAKQETLDPLKALGRFVGYGVAGAVCFGIGSVLIGVGALRAIQTNAHLEGDYSWVPYLAVVVLCLIFAVVAVSRIGKTPRGPAR
jgi:Putative Actinobacterial Holin-X, holin superfamily III